MGDDGPHTSEKPSENPAELTTDAFWTPEYDGENQFNGNELELLLCAGTLVQAELIELLKFQGDRGCLDDTHFKARPEFAAPPEGS